MEKRVSLGYFRNSVEDWEKKWEKKEQLRGIILGNRKK